MFCIFAFIQNHEGDAYLLEASLCQPFIDWVSCDTFALLDASVGCEPVGSKYSPNFLQEALAVSFREAHKPLIHFPVLL